MGSCIGGMFIINPNEVQTTVAGNAAANATTGLGAHTLTYTLDPAYTLAVVGATAVDFCTIENLNGAHAVALEDYVEEGIPAYIRVSVFAVSPGEGQITITYGDVDSDWTAGTLVAPSDLVLLNNIAASELTSGSSYHTNI